MKTTHCACKVNVEKKRASQAVRQRKIYYRKREKLTGFREKPALSFYSQPFLYPINGELSPGGRGPQFIFSPQLGSCGHTVEGVSLSGHIVLRNWHEQGETGYCLQEKQDTHQSNVTTVTSSLVCQVTTMGHLLTICYEPLVNANVAAFLI